MILEKLNANPWRFTIGDNVYVANWPQETVKVTAAFGHGRSSWPHYVVVDSQGIEWTLPQQCLSRSPIVL